MSCDDDVLCIADDCYGNACYCSGCYDALAARLAEARQLLQDAALYGCNSKWAARLAAHLAAPVSQP